MSQRSLSHGYRLFVLLNSIVIVNTDVSIWVIYLALVRHTHHATCHLWWWYASCWRRRRRQASRTWSRTLCQRRTADCHTPHMCTHLPLCYLRIYQKMPCQHTQTDVYHTTVFITIWQHYQRQSMILFHISTDRHCDVSIDVHPEVIIYVCKAILWEKNWATNSFRLTNILVYMDIPDLQVLTFIHQLH